MMYQVLTATEGLSYGDWLSFRRLGIGGSDASIVCGVNRYTSSIELWMDKTGQFPCQEAGEPAYWGQQLESLVKTEFTKRTGIEVTPVHQILQSETYPFMLANLDGICECSKHGTCVFEAKTASAFKSSEWDNKIPPEYMLQVQHYMAVTGYKGTYIAVLIGGNQFDWRFIARDDELIDMLIQLEHDFWEHVKTKIPPIPDGSEASAKFLNELFPESIEKSQIPLPDEAVGLICQYDNACEQLERYTEQKREAENLLKLMLGKNENGTSGNNVLTWKTVTQEHLDTKAFKEEHPGLFLKYTKQATHRRFSIKHEEE